MDPSYQQYSDSIANTVSLVSPAASSSLDSANYYSSTTSDCSTDHNNFNNSKIVANTDEIEMEFTSLSPIRARQWEQSQTIQRNAEWRERLEREMTVSRDSLSEDEIDSDSHGMDSSENGKDDGYVMNQSQQSSANQTNNSTVSDMVSPQQSTPSSNHPNNWDIDSLLEEHMREIDDCDFGSLNRGHLLGRTGQQQQQQQQQKQDMRQNHQQPPRQQVQQQQTARHNQPMKSLQTIQKSNNFDSKMQSQPHPTPSKMAQITLSEQSTVSSPGWSATDLVAQSQKGQSSTIAAATSNAEPASFSKQPTRTNVPPPTPMPKLPQPLQQPTPPNTQESTKVHSLQLQLNQLQTQNATLQSRIEHDALKIQQLSSLEEEARQEAALWEAQWRNDGGDNLLLEDLRGALLQKTKEEVKELQMKLMQMNHSGDAVEMNLLQSENEVLRKELSTLLSHGPSSPSSTAQSEAMRRLDRMAQTSRESEQKWAARVKGVEEKLDLLRRDNKVLIGENERLKCDMEGISKNYEGEKKLKEMENMLNRDRGEISRLVKEKSELVEELRKCRDIIDKTRADHESIRSEFETRLKEQTQLHSAELEKVWGKKKPTMDRGSDAIPFNDEKLESALAQTSQENMTLREENASVSAENERLAKRCVELETSVKEAVSSGEDLRLALLSAESRIDEFEKEKAELEESVREIEQRVASAAIEEEETRRRLDETVAAKESVERQLQSVLSDKDQLSKDLLALKRENEMIEAKNVSLEEYHANAQEELKSWQTANEELEAKLSATAEENATLTSNNLAMKERLDERQLLLDTIRKNEVDGPLVDENRLLKTSLSGLENQLHRVESSLEKERASLTSTEQARQHAEKRIGELENQMQSLQNEINTAHSKTASEKDHQLRLEKQTTELKETIATLREEISSAAISRSHLELELRQRQDECVTLRKQLDPVQQEKYRLELDNVNLSEQIESMRKPDRSDLDQDGMRSDLVKRLEEKNDALAECISSLQTDMIAFQNKSSATHATYVRLDKSAVDTACHNLTYSSSTPKSTRPMIPRDMMQQLDRARAAVKETASIIKAQRRALDSTVLLSPIPTHSSQSSQSSSLLPSEIATAPLTQLHNQSMSADRAMPSTPSVEARSNLQSQLEDEHMAEKSAIKTKYRERIRRIQKEWEGERKAILNLIASPSVGAAGNELRVVKSPVNNRSVSLHSESVPQHVMAKTPYSTCCDTETIDSSYVETETFVMNILNELDG